MYDNFNFNCYQLNTVHRNRRYAHSAWHCAFCNGTGHDPRGIMGTETCPACKGSGWWEADISIDRFLPCGHCSGKGRLEVFGFLKLCDVCGGSGRV